MKALCLVTYTDCENKWRSLQAAGHEVHVVQYDDRPHDRHGELVDAARRIAPDFIVHIGAVEKYHGRPVPRPAIFRALKKVAPLIHMCNDGADEPWWDDLELYQREDCFTVQVSIDGSRRCPIAGYSNGLILLTPIDHRSFKPLFWPERTIHCGMVGGIGHSQRLEAVSTLRDRGVLCFNQGPIGRSYDDMAQRMCETKLTFNYGCTGTGNHLHVKGRVVEAGFAGSALLELKGSPAKDWFTPGIDYLEYGNIGEAMLLITSVSDGDLRAMAARLHTRMCQEHHPGIFWNTVLAKAGVATC